MSQNVAFLIGVPNCKSHKFYDLPACDNDVEQMSDLIEATKRFNKIQKLIDYTSSEIQEALKSVGAQSEEIDEIFIYFTGHGHTSEDDFYWVAKGFDVDSPRSTGVSEKSLMEILREIDAKHTIIVQDACFSGQALYKKTFAETLPPLSNLIKFSSSAANAETPAGVIVSPFTDHFIEAASTAKSEGVVDYLAVTQKLNDLLEKDQLKPHLGYQGTSKQIFCDDASYLAKIRAKYEVSVVRDFGTFGRLS